MQGEILKVVTLLVALIQGSWAQTTGTIKGAVLSNDGQPMAGAEIHVAENKPFSGHRLVQMHESDEHGQFVINGLAWGTYLVMVGKESAGYPDSRLAFYSNLAVPSVTLAPQFPIATVNLNIGPKAGTLEIQSITDAVTGKQIDSAVVTLKRANSDFSIETSAPGARILVPPSVDITIDVHALGYNPWPGNNDPKVGLIHLNPGQKFTLDVILHPIAAGVTGERR